MKALEYTLKGMSNADIGELLGVDRSTVWRWTQTEEWMKTFNDMQHEIKKQGENKILGELNTYIEELKRLALTSDSEKTRYDSLTYLIDRVMGKSTAKVEQVNDAEDKDKVTEDILDQELKEFDSE